MDSTKKYFTELKETAQQIDAVVRKLSYNFRNPAAVLIAFDEDKIAGQNAMQEVKRELEEMQEGLEGLNQMLYEAEEFSCDLNKMKQELAQLTEKKHDLYQLFLETGYQSDEETLELLKTRDLGSSMLRSNENNPCDELETSEVNNITSVPKNRHMLYASTPLVFRHHVKK